MDDIWAAASDANRRAMDALTAACLKLAREGLERMGTIGTPAVIGRLATEGGKAMKARIEGGEPDELFDGSMSCVPVPLVLLADFRLAGEADAVLRPGMKAGMPCLAARDGTLGPVLNFSGGSRLAWEPSCKGKLRRLRATERIAFGPGPGEMALEGGEARHDSYCARLMQPGCWAVVTESAASDIAPGELIQRIRNDYGPDEMFCTERGGLRRNPPKIRVRNLRKGERVVID